MKKNINTLNEEINRIRKLMTFTIKENSLDYLVEQKTPSTVEVFKDKGGSYQYSKLPNGTYWYKAGGSGWKQQTSEKGINAIEKRINSDKVESKGKVDPTTIDSSYKAAEVSTVSGTDGSEVKTGTETPNVKGTETEVGGGKNVDTQTPKTIDKEKLCTYVTPRIKESVTILEEIKRLVGIRKMTALRPEKKEEIQKTEDDVSQKLSDIKDIDCKEVCSDENMVKINSGIEEMNALLNSGEADAVKDKIERLLTLLTETRSECERVKKEVEEKNKKSVPTTSNTGIENTTILDNKSEVEVNAEIEEISITDENGDEVVKVDDNETKEVDELSFEEKVQALNYYEREEGRGDRKKEFTKTQNLGNLSESKCKTHLRQIWKTWRDGTMPSAGSTEAKTTELCWCTYGKSFDKVTKIQSMITDFEKRDLINLDTCPEGGVIGARYTIKNDKGQVLGHVKKVNDNKYRFIGKQGRTYIERNDSGYFWADTVDAQGKTIPSIIPGFIADPLNVDLNKKTLTITKADGKGNDGLFRIDNKINEWLDNFIGGILN